jgi:demethylmenaquinone methyltransferase / 2-methoxy-6-polyprenyl-1,4-benzoquinol methylase
VGAGEPLPRPDRACEPAGVAPNPVTAVPPPDERLRGEPVAREVFSGLPARYDRLAYLLSFGQDRRWRRAVTDHAAAAAPQRVLDVATGPAGVALAVAARTGADVVGVDLNEPMLRAGLANVRRPGPRGRVRLAAGRAGQLPFADASFDAVTFSYLLRYVDNPAATIAEMARCLRPGGTLASLEFHVPPQPVWHAAWWCYTRLALPLLGGITGGRAWYEVGRFLGPSISGHYRQHPLGAHVAAWRAAGLTGVGVELMSLGGGLIMWGQKGQPDAAGPVGPPGAQREGTEDSPAPGSGS